MNKDKQRIAIAEICGFRFVGESGRYPEDEDWQKYKAVYHGDGFIGLARPDWIPVPDYVTDLNDMHKAEKVMFAFDSGIENGGYRTRYLDALLRICAGGFHAGIHATAEQRAEAFLRTLGKWTDEA